MTVHVIETKAERALAEQFRAVLPHLPGMRERRAAAFATFEKTGLPSRRLESWHYTDWKGRQRETLPLVEEPLADGLAIASGLVDPFSGIDAYNVLLVNNDTTLLSEQPDQVDVVDLVEAARTGHPLMAHLGTAFPASADPMVALNEAMFVGGVVARLRKGARLVKPAHASATAAAMVPSSVHARSLIIVEDGVELTLLDSVTGRDDIDFQLSTVVEFIIGDNAKVEYITYNRAGARSQAFIGVGVRMGRNSQFNTVNFAHGVGFGRHQVHVAMAGEGSKLGVRGAALITGEQHFDHTLTVEHIAPGCESRELFRTVVDGQGTGVFQGKIVVRKEAQKTDGQMASNALLLSDDATMNNKPELEIFADDVVCAHGATCGALDEELLFYLQARGLPKKEAEALMVQAFIGEVLEFVSHEEARERLSGVVEGWLAGRG
ncbi:MAG TPA: Fe-S cluster assembly protein SufD [Beijerinckiaceae bacterium]|nr:Fe-S cluster assembly protein SufD [Beijerinckiaceae bacterium]